jgi:hypothetical protein
VARLPEMDTRVVAGFTRYACVGRPAGASPSSPRPLVLWFHPGGLGADNLSETQLPGRYASFDLGGPNPDAGPTGAGFFLVAIQGRNLRFPTLANRDGRHHDFYFRDLASPSTNPDVAYADALVDDLVATGNVDPRRIYVMGWSNGAFFGQLYALARHATPTPGGSYVAAASVFSAGNPFEEVRWDVFAGTPRVGPTSCQVAPPAVTVPIQMVYRTCDAAVAVSAEQAACFETEPGYTTVDWLGSAATAGLTITPLMLAGRERGNTDATAGTVTTFGGTCPVSCPLPLTVACVCLQNHLLWPDGAYDNNSTGLDRELDMLQFLKAHPR